MTCVCACAIAAGVTNALVYGALWQMARVSQHDGRSLRLAQILCPASAPQGLSHVHPCTPPSRHTHPHLIALSAVRAVSAALTTIVPSEPTACQWSYPAFNDA